MATKDAKTEIEEAGPKRILVAEDEHLVATGVAASLSEIGYDVVGPVSDGEQAIERCRLESPCLALVDIRMPKMDGLTAAKNLYTEFGVPVVIFSAYSDEQYVDEGNDIGVFGYLLKPATQDQLRVAIAVAWRRYLESREQAGEIDRLETRLAERRVIEQAKWMLVERRGISEPDALRLLQREARRRRAPLIEVAQGLIDNDSLLSQDLPS